MKNQFQKTALKILFFIFFISNSQAQTSNSNFEIKFFTVKNRIAMESQNGNNWTSLFVKSKSFDLNQNGMVQTEKDSEATSNSKYIFSVTRKGTKITLIGKKGTNWEKLVFEIPSNGSYVSINQNGIKV